MVSKWFCILILLISNIFTHETIIAVDAQYQPAQQGDSKDGSGIASAELLFDGELETLEWIGKDDEVLLLLTTTKQVWRSGDNGMTWKMVTDDLKTLTNTAGGDPAYARLIASIQTNKNSQSSANPTNNNQQTTTAGISPNKPSPFGVVDIIVSEVDSDFVFLRGNGAHSYASINGGLNWYVSTIPSSQPDDLKTEFETVTPHPTNKNYLLATSLTLKCTKKKQGLSNCRRILWRSKDWGQNWEKMHDYIIQADWYYNIPEDKRNGEPEESILATISGKQSGDQKFGVWDKDVNLIKSDDGFRSTNIVLLGGNKFLFTDDFLFVARAEVGDKGVSLSLKISADGGKTFAHGKLPKEMQHAYTMLDSEDGAVFLHVNHQGSSLNYGNIYISDATGFNYTLSLAYNRRDADGKCDFEKVAGLEGIYIANYISNAQEIEDWEKESSKPASISNIKDQNPEESPFGNVQKQKHGFGIGSSAFSGEKMINKMDKTSKRISPKPKEKVKTVITHDRGGMWTVLRPPERDANGKPIDCSSSDCSLHLNGISGEWGPFYTAESATGLIMATGNVGPQLSKAAGEINTYFSRDAGLTWEEVRKGSRMYEFGDHGGIIVMADDVNPTESLEFSWTQGSSWSLHKFTNTGPLVIENIITEPSSTGEKFILYGTKKLPNGKSTGALYAVDFSKYHSRICQGVAQAGSASSDYELWSPHDGRYEDKCLLGHKLDITRRKRDAACFNPEEHERIVKQYDCPCAESDYECDYGYFRKVQGGPCVRDESITIDREGLIPDHCPPGSTYTISNGYRKIAGDTCIVEGGLNRVPSAFPCPGGVLGVSYNGWIVTFIVVSMIIMLVLTNAGGPKNRSTQKLSTINIFFGKALDLARRIVQLILFYGPRSWKDTYNRFTGSKYDYSDYNEVGKEGIEPESFYDDDREHGNKKYKSEDPFDDAIDDMEAVEYKGDEPFSSSSKFQPLPKKVLPSQPVPLLSAPRAAQPTSISTAKKPVDQNQYQYTDINFDDLDAV